MKIKKISGLLSALGKVLNGHSTSQNDTYSCDYINNLQSKNEIYSTEEVRIGTWIDGKPLYRKTIFFDNIDDTSYPHNIANVDKIWINLEDTFFIDSTDTETTPFLFTGINSNESKEFVNIYLNLVRNVNRNNVIFNIGKDAIYRKAYVTFKYTKTTD